MFVDGTRLAYFITLFYGNIGRKGPSCAEGLSPLSYAWMVVE